MKKRIVFELAAGILILVSALYTYVPKSQYMYELTFISNMAGAGLLLSDAIYASVKRKWLPSVLFFIVMVQFGQRYGSNDEELGYRKENINE